MTAPRVGLAISFVAATAARVMHAALTDPLVDVRSDNAYFLQYARSVAQGHWGRLPSLDGSRALSVKFPPLWPWTLGLGQRLLWFLDADTANATIRMILGASVAPLIGLLVWRMLDRVPVRRRRSIAVGTALIAAAHPLLIGATNSLLAEVLVVPLNIAILLALERIRRRGSSPVALGTLGVLIGLAALARPEAIILWGAAVAVLAWMLGRRSVLVVPLAVAAVPILAFSVVASAAARTPVLVSTNTASAIAGANCDETFSGESIGHWRQQCLFEVWLGRIPSRERKAIFAYVRQPRDRFPLQLGARIEGMIQDAHRRGAVHAMRQDPVGVIRAVPFRVARGVGLWWSPDQERLERAEGRVLAWERVGRWFHIVVVLPAFAFAAIGAARRRGRLAALLDRCTERRALLPLAAALGVWLLGVVVTHGSTRHRSAVDAIFLVGAAIGYAMLGAGRAGPARDRDATTAGAGGEPSAGA